VSAEAVSLKLLCSHGTARLVSHAPARPPSRSSHVGAPCRAAHLPVVYARGRCGLILKMKRYEQSAPEAQLDDAPQQCLIAYPMHPGDTLLSSHFFPPPPPQRTRSQTSRARPKREKRRGHRGKAKELVIEVSCAACALQRHPHRLHRRRSRHSPTLNHKLHRRSLAAGTSDRRWRRRPMAGSRAACSTRECHGQ